MDTDNFIYHSDDRLGYDGYYTCKKCRDVANKKYNNPECHLCSDWNGCGRDCTLSSVYCKKCKVEDGITRH